MTKFSGVLLVICVPIGLYEALRAAESTDTPLRPTMLLQGSHSQIKKERVQKIDSSEVWKKLWSEHRGKRAEAEYNERDQDLDIDFDSHTVVAIFVGNGTDDCEVFTLRRGDSTVIQFHPRVWQIEGMIFGRQRTVEELRYEAMCRASAPYAFVILPKTNQKIEVEIGHQPQLDQPVNWKYYTTFAK